MKKIFALLALAAITLYFSPPAAAQSSTKAKTKASVPKANLYVMPAVMSIDSMLYAKAGVTFDSAKGITYKPTTNAAATARPKIVWGTGSPLNVVSAPVASVYLRLDGGTSTTLYVKTAGTDSAGWTPK